MTFDEVLDQVRELLQQRGRVTYRSLKLRYQIDDELLAGITDELVKAERVAVDEDGEVLIWTGGTTVVSPQSPTPSTRHLDAPRSTLHAQRSDGERRQLTVMFIDLVGSTTLSQQLDPEDYHARVVAYQSACQQIITRYEGHIAQYLGDGVLVYFGYPTAHEEDAVRAVRSGLEIVTAVNQLAYTPPLQVRVGIHTGPVVVGEIGAGEHTEKLALGETPNIAARIQGQANPNEVMISVATYRLVEGLFTCEDRGQPGLKGVAVPLTLYRILTEGEAHTRFEVSVQKGLTPLVGRESELGMLRQHWDQAKAGAGHVVLLSGEPGIGKSRLVQELKEYVSAEGATRIEFRCSPYHQNTALYPIIEHLQRLLQFQSAETPQIKLAILTQLLSQYRFPQAETLSLLVALFSLPPPAGMPPLSFSPQKQKQLTLEALAAWLLEEAERAVVYCAWEDLHWADPSTLEVLTLLLDQVPTTRLLALLTFRPEFIPPWGNRSHFSQMTLSRLGRPQVEAMVEKVTRGKALPVGVVQQIVTKTDGVPLFVEELTKTVLESIESLGSIESIGSAIPTTLHDSLMARLDRLGTAKEIAQLGATIGREFSYELLHAVSFVSDEALQHGLKQLVEAELVYQRGLVPQAHYLFKHALVQDTAYQSLLKSRRQQLHQKVAQVLAEQFPETKETQPELVAHHYTEAGLTEQAILYWHRAGQRAIERSANVEAIRHLTKGLELLNTLPDTPERTQQELDLQFALGTPLIASKGYAAPEVEYVYTRARDLCRQVEETPQLSRVLYGLWNHAFVRAELGTAQELGEQLLRLAQRLQDPVCFLDAHMALGWTLLTLGAFAPARVHAEQGVAIYDAHKHHLPASLYWENPEVSCRGAAAWILWCLGYPDQALKKIHEGLILAQELSHPYSLVYALTFATFIHQFRREGAAVQERAETQIAVASEHEFPYWLEWGTMLQGWALAEQGQIEKGVAQMRQSLAASGATRTGVAGPYNLALLVEGYMKMEQPEEGLAVLTEALAEASKTGERHYEAELYRLRGELLLTQEGKRQKAKITEPRPLNPDPQDEAEGCFLKAIEVARNQQAKSLELRAAMSLARLWQQQGKKAEAHQMLVEIYGWFIEGFDTQDLKDAKALLDALA
jgi:class 3 adenylate cyclase/predicted ATPase